MLRHFIPRNDGRVFAFTLAEVLITLVIIGVVAALTIPNLMQKYQEQATVKKVQKVYSNISNAYAMAIKDNGLADEWDWGGLASPEGAQNALSKISPYLNKIKLCTNRNNPESGTFCPEYVVFKSLDGSQAPAANYNSSGFFAKAMLPDGVMLMLTTVSKDCKFYYGTGQLASTCGALFVDINGAKKPNQYGVDIFMFFLTKDSVIPRGTKNAAYSFETGCNKGITDHNNGSECAAWVVYKGNMDYLHCNDLSWTGKDKCK